MNEISLEEVISEEAFAALLERESEMYLRLARSLVDRADSEWSRRHYYQLTSEADTLEAFLDDYGARYNKTYSFLREVIASARSLALAGFSITHLTRRIDSYRTSGTMSPSVLAEAKKSIHYAKAFVEASLRNLLTAALEEVRKRGMSLPSQAFPEERYSPEAPRLTLPRTVGQEEGEEEKHKVTEIVAKFLQACEMFKGVSVRRIEDEKTRETYLLRHCSEERARVYEATVHNLQSAYDTHIKNTSIELHDARLPQLRGHVSATLHLLEAVTHLTHFVERHEGSVRHDSTDRRIEALVSRVHVRDVTLNHLLLWGSEFMLCGRSLAEDLLSSHTNVQVLNAVLPEDAVLHARPAALIVGITNRYGTPVEMEVGGSRCNAGSILELMVAVGSHPNERQFTFRGDEKPLRDIALLFQHGLGEDGVEKLPSELSYLRDQ